MLIEDIGVFSFRSLQFLGAAREANQGQCKHDQGTFVEGSVDFQKPVIDLQRCAPR